MKIFIAFGFWLMFFPPPGDQQPSKLQSLKWMIGDWQMQTRKGQMIESWEMKNYRMHKVFYIPTVENQNNRKPVKFTLLINNNNSFTAVNNEHDYPKKISYRLYGNDSLHAKIDDGEDVPVKFSNFYFTRKN